MTEGEKRNNDVCVRLSIWKLSLKHITKANAQWQISGQKKWAMYVKWERKYTYATHTHTVDETKRAKKKNAQTQVKIKWNMYDSMSSE